MKTCFAAILTFGAMSLPAVAQTGTDAAGNIPRLADGHPDLNGVWQIPYTADMSRSLGGKLPYTPRGEAEFKNYDPSKFDYTAHCLPPGLTRAINTPDPIEITQTKDRLVILFEGFSSFITVPIDGRPHPAKLEPTWFGNSVGHWEGDTLVIDTIGFNDKTRLDTIGHAHSDQLHVIQRFTRADAKHIQFEITVEDPVMYTEPFKNLRTFTLRPDWQLMEYVCEENNKDVKDGHVK